MASAAKKVLVPIANGTEPIEAVITIDVLRRSGADVSVASVENQHRVDAGHAVKIVADALISDCANTVFDGCTMEDSGDAGLIGNADQEALSSRPSRWLLL
uniref:DJ-1/PfpI domain-containing protein n=1 Tax=Fagus sylvatica TaxID=28930 RepID=A0A2N9FL03_FAGSY